MQRLGSRKHPNYRHYGGRGLKLSPRWLDYLGFPDDMGEKPPGLSIERIDNEKGYGPDNCRWATMHEQSMNKRSNRYLTVRGETLHISDMAMKYGIGLSTLKVRLHRGRSDEDAVLTPVKGKR